MGIFIKTRKGTLKEHKTIGEKKEELKNKINDKTLSKSQRSYASKKLQELNDLTDKKKAVSKTFAGKDGELTGNRSNPKKVRYGVCTRVRKDGSLNINPFMPKKDSLVQQEKQVEVKAQKKLGSGEHAVRVKAIPNINIDSLCEDKGLPGKKTRILTDDEFRTVKNLSKGNKKKRKP